MSVDMGLRPRDTADSETTSVRDVLESVQNRLAGACEIAEEILKVIQQPKPIAAAESDKEVTMDREPLANRATMLDSQAELLQNHLRTIIVALG